jgi:hypothetical protein
MKHCNTCRPHQELGNKTPSETYRPKPNAKIIGLEVKLAQHDPGSRRAHLGET